MNRRLIISCFIAIISTKSFYAWCQEAPPSSLDDLQRQINEAKAKANAHPAKRAARSSATRSRATPQSDPPRNLDASPRQGTLHFANGGNYQGGILNNQPDGQGTFTATDGQHFVGSFAPGHASGTWDNGYKYDGGFTDGYRNGYGVMIYQDGSRYEGGWVNGFRSGFGVDTWPGGRKFQGIFGNDHPNGQGTFWNSDGRVASGNWVNGCLNSGGWWAITVDASSCGK